MGEMGGGGAPLGASRNSWQRLVEHAIASARGRVRLYRQVVQGMLPAQTCCTSMYVPSLSVTPLMVTGSRPAAGSLLDVVEPGRSSR